MHRSRALVLLAALTLVAVVLQRGAAAQTLQWMPARQPSMAHAQPMAYDRDRARTVLFGQDELGAAATWELKGRRWSQRPGVTNPSMRGGHGLAYDARRGRIVMFGGSGQWGALAETWEYDGADWQNVTPTGGPGPLTFPAMAFDYAAMRVVLFGGADLHGFVRDETWQWDGASWTQLLPPASPPPRYQHGMCSDVARQRLVVVGGQSNATYHTDTWEWDGAVWSLRHSSSPGGNWRALAYDELRARCVLFGGGSGFITNDTFEWDGATWLLRTPATRPPSRFAHALAYDADQGRTILFGGISSASAPLSDTWAFDGTDWQLLQANPRRGTNAVFDPIRQVGLALAAGQTRNVLEWDGVAWAERPFAAGPAARNQSLIAFDTARQRLVLFGGADAGSALLDELWEWDGAAWSSPNPTPRPAARTRFGLAYDAQRQRTVLFGGIDSANVPLADTWEWDGSSWNLRQPANSPPARFAFAMAYDAARQETVLFGGSMLFLHLADTWVFDGANWQQRLPPQNPSGRHGSALAYDPLRQRLVLCGGAANLFTYPYVVNFNDTWEWDGSLWTPVAVGGNPPVGGQGSLLVDSARQRTHWLGSSHWILGLLQPANVAASGAGCGGSLAPTLRATTPSIGNPEVLVDIVGAAPSAYALFTFAFQTQAASIGGGCTVLVQNPLFSRLVATKPRGFAATAFAVPNVTWLRGVTCHVQGATLDPGSAIGLALTARLSLTIGD